MEQLGYPPAAGRITFRLDRDDLPGCDHAPLPFARVTRLANSRLQKATDQLVHTSPLRTSFVLDTSVELIVYPSDQLSHTLTISFARMLIACGVSRYNPANF